MFLLWVLQIIYRQPFILLLWTFPSERRLVTSTIWSSKAVLRAMAIWRSWVHWSSLSSTSTSINVRVRRTPLVHVVVRVLGTLITMRQHLSRMMAVWRRRVPMVRDSSAIAGRSRQPAPPSVHRELSPEAAVLLWLRALPPHATAAHRIFLSSTAACHEPLPAPPPEYQQLLSDAAAECRPPPASSSTNWRLFSKTAAGSWPSPGSPSVRRRLLSDATVDCGWLLTSSSTRWQLLSNVATACHTFLFSTAAGHENALLSPCLCTWFHVVLQARRPRSVPMTRPTPRAAWLDKTLPLILHTIPGGVGWNGAIPSVPAHSRLVTLSNRSSHGG